MLSSSYAYLVGYTELFILSNSTYVYALVCPVYLTQFFHDRKDAVQGNS